jgi:hypothetical protein
LSTALSSPAPPKKEDGHGLLSLLLGLAKAIVFPFDKVLAGMVGTGLCAEALCQFLGLTRTLLDAHIVRLDLRSPSDKPFRRPSARGWSIDDTKRLIAWRSVGVHPDVIGERLSKQRSANAVRAKARRLGLDAPPRKTLFHPDPASLRDPPAEFAFGAEVGSPASNCGRAAGPISLPIIQASEPAAQPAKLARASTRGHRPEDQRELPLFSIVGGAEDPRQIVPDAPPAGPAKPVPTTVADVEFTDLSWIGRLKRPLTHEPAVWAVGMLMMSGLHWRVAAEMVGKSAAAFRTLRSRMGVPVDLDRKKIRIEFDQEVARATLEESKYVVRKSLVVEGQKGPAEYFWVEARDRGTRLSPLRRKRDRLIERRPPEMRIVTRAELDARARNVEPPFARGDVRVSA